MSGRLDEARAVLDEYRVQKGNEPPGLFDAIERGLSNADPEWREQALTAVYRTACALDVLTVDDVMDRLSARTYDMRALGGIMREAARHGWIERNAQQWATSRRPGTHARPIAVWQSRIAEQEPRLW